MQFPQPPLPRLHALAFLCAVGYIMVWLLLQSAFPLLRPGAKWTSDCGVGFLCGPVKHLAQPRKQPAPATSNEHLPPLKCQTQHKQWTFDCHMKCNAGGGGGTAALSGSTARTEETLVPRIAHFVHIGGPLRLQHWLAVMSAVKFVPARRVFIYYMGDVTSCWSKVLQKNPLVHFQPMNESHFPLKVGNWDLYHIPHHTDFVRLSALWQYGGVYMDFDAILTKPFLPLLGYEAVVSKQRSQEVANGLLMARPRSCFICAYAQEACITYNGSWDAHSVLTLSSIIHNPELSRITRGIKVLSYSEGFFPFSWQKEFLVQMFETDMKNMTFQLSDVYSIHLFSTSVNRNLDVTFTWDWMKRSRSVVAAAMRNALTTPMKAHLGTELQSPFECSEAATAEDWDDAAIQDVGKH